MNKTEVLDRLSEVSIDILKKVNPSLQNLEEIRVSDLIEIISKADKGFAETFESLKLSKRSNKIIKIQDLLSYSYYEAYLSGSDRVELKHLVFGLLFHTNTDKYYQVKKSYSRNKDAQLDTELSKYVTDFTKLAKKKKQEFIGRDKELTRLIVGLSSENQKPMLLIGDSGSGKTSLMMELSKRINEGRVPKNLLNSRILQIKFTSLVGMISTENNAVSNVFLSRLFSYLASVDQDKYQKTILFFDDLRFGLNIFIGIETLNPEGKILLVGAAHNDLQDKLWESPVMKMWDVISVEDQKDSESKKIMRAYADRVYRKTKVKFSDESIAKMIDIFKVEIMSDVLPGGGLTMIDQLSVFKSHVSADYSAATAASRPTTIVVTEEDVEAFFEGYNSDKKDSITSNLDNNKLKNIEKELKRKIIGQDKAINALARALRVTSLKLRSESRPVGSFLFLGPTGVGKTETAKALATTLFGFRDRNKLHPANFLRIDMSEFAEKHTVSKLFGAPPGYVGYEEGGSLAEYVSENPSCVVLFDEIDKAHPEVLNSLLHVMDEGEVRTSAGDIVSFEEVIIIMTSNHGADLIDKPEMGFLPDAEINLSAMEYTEWQKKLILFIKKTLKPEFINRFDDIIVFDKLNKDSLLQILDILIMPVTLGLKKRKINLKITKQAKIALVQQIKSNEYGARELKRTLNKEAIDPISKILLRKRKVTSIKMALDDGKISIKAEK